MCLLFIWDRPCKNVSYGICEQQRCRSACKILASFCSCAGWFECYLVTNSQTHFRLTGPIFGLCLVTTVYNGDVNHVHVDSLSKKYLSYFNINEMNRTSFLNLFCQKFIFYRKRDEIVNSLKHHHSPDKLTNFDL